VLLKVQQVAIEAKRFEFAVSGDEQRASGSFVAAARLDADEAVLHQVDASDGVASANFVQQFHERYGIESLAAHRNRHAFFESNLNLLFLVGRLLRRLRKLPRAGEWRTGGVFQFSAFVAQVPDVAIAAVNFLTARGDGNAAFFGVVETIFARLELPLAPRGHDLQLGSQRLVSHLKAHLVVALARAAVADGSCAFALRHFDLMFRDYGSRQRGAKQIFVLIDRARFQRRPDVASQELFAQIFDHYLAGSGLVRLVDDGLEPSRVGENNFFRRLRHGRVCSSPKSGPWRRPAAISV